jgi:multidrug efflux system membrane fusion protein
MAAIGKEKFMPLPRFQRRWLLLLPALVLLYLLAGWLRGPSVEAVHPAIGPAVEGIYATGTVEATVMMPIAARSAARLMELNADEGSRVAKGQVLAQLEDTDLRNNLKQLQAKERYAAASHGRTAAIAAKGFATRDERDRTLADWNAAKADVAAAQAQVNYLKLLAPAEGVIIRRDGEIGQLIPANEPVFWISCCAPLRISAEVDEEDISQIQPGQPVLIRADAFPGKIFHGKVESITPKGDPIARSYRVRITFTEEVPLLIGMTAETNIEIGRNEQALMVPTSALQAGKLWVVLGGRLHTQEITTGARDANSVEIKTGITKDDVIVARPSAELEEGKRVHPSFIRFKPKRA